MANIYERDPVTGDMYRILEGCPIGSSVLGPDCSSTVWNIQDLRLMEREWYETLAGYANID